MMVKSECESRSFNDKIHVDRIEQMKQTKQITHALQEGVGFDKSVCFIHVANFLHRGERRRGVSNIRNFELAQLFNGSLPQW